MADTRTFPATSAQFYSLAALLSAHGLPIDTAADGGEEKQGKWDVVWAYDGTTLTLTVKSHPFAQEDIMWSKVQAALS